MNGKSMKQCICLTSVLVAALMPLQAQTVELEYGPEDGSIFAVVETVTHESRAGEAETVTDVRERRSLVVVSAVPMPSPDSIMVAGNIPSLTITVPETGEWYTNRVTIVSQSLKRNGNAIVSPVYAALAGLALTYHLDANGRLIRIEGYDHLGAAMADMLPDKLASTLGRLVDSDALRRQAVASYREVYGPFTGGTVRLAAAEVSAARHDLPGGGSVPLYAVTNIEVVDGSDEADMVQLTRTFNSDAAELAEEFNLDADEVLTSAGAIVPLLPETHASVSVTGEETVHVQIEGALVESRTCELTTVWTLAEAPDVEHSVTETRKFSSTFVGFEEVEEASPAGYVEP